LFISRGVTEEIVDCFRKRLRTMLLERIESKSIGRVWYRDPEHGIVVAIELVEGSVAACRGMDERGNIVEGRECLELAAKHLDDERGVIEFERLDRPRIELDLAEYPGSRVSVEDSRKLVERLRQRGPVEEARGAAVGGEMRVERLDTRTMLRILERARLSRVLGPCPGTAVIEVVRRSMEEERSIYLSLQREDGSIARVALYPAQRLAMVDGIEAKSFRELLDEIASKSFRRAALFELEAPPS